MARVLLTGMSGTGKSTLLAELARRGIRTVDTDDGGWSQEVPDRDTGDLMQVWHEDRMGRLLAGPTVVPTVVSGTVSNQGRFYDRFDSVVLLSAPTDVLLERVRMRPGNQFGKDPADLRRILSDLVVVEPLLRATATRELDATRRVPDLADELEALARLPGQNT